MATSLVRKIMHLQPCEEAVAWLRNQQTPSQAWRDCPDGSWMLWLLGTQVTGAPWSEGRKTYLACALDCAETVRHLWPEAQLDQLTKAVMTLRGWVAGLRTVADASDAAQAVRNAARAARRTANAASSHAAKSVSDAAWAAAAASRAARRAAAAAAEAATAVAASAAGASVSDAAWAAAAASRAAPAKMGGDVAEVAAKMGGDVAEVEILARCANIVRQHYPRPPRIRAVQTKAARPKAGG